MSPIRVSALKSDLVTLEAAAQAARSGFACLFSSSDEYEMALITERRAQGRYRKGRTWPVIAFAACVVAMAATVIWFA